MGGMKNTPPPGVASIVSISLNRGSLDPHSKNKPFRKASALVAIVGALLMTPSVGSGFAPNEMVTNPGFETGTTSAWAESPGGIAAVTGQAHTGTYAGRASQYSQLRQTVTGLLPYTSYTCSAWVKVTTAGQANYFTVDAYGGSQQLVISGTDYAQKSITFTTSGTSTSARMTFYQAGTSYGYIDDVSLLQVGPPNFVVNPGLETGATSGWTESYGTTSAVTGQAHANIYAGRVSLGGGLRQTVTGLQPNRTYTASAWLKAASAGQGIYLIVDNYGGGSLNASTSGTAYVQKTITFTTSGTNTSARICAYQSGTNYGYCDDLSITGTTGGTGDLTGSQSDRIADCLQSFGVNTFSLLNWDTQYPWSWGGSQGHYDPYTTGSAINYITGTSGLTMNVREYHKDWSGTTAITPLQMRWIKTLYGLTGSPFTIALGMQSGTNDVPGIASMVLDSGTSGLNYVKWVEGINEPNNIYWPVGNATTDATQAYLYQQVHAITSNVTVMGPSIIPNSPMDATLTNYMGIYQPTILSNLDANNIHIYPQHSPNFYDGTSRGGQLADVDTAFRNVLPGRPAICTEFHPTLYVTNTNQKKNPTYDAYWGPIFLLSAYWDFDWKASFWFSLFDHDTSMTTGLFATSNTDPKPVANAFRALFNLTGDTGADKLTFAPEKIDVSVAGLPVAPTNAPRTGGRWALFENSAHQYFLMIWNEQDNISATTTPVTVTFHSHNMAKVEEFNITSGGMTAIQSPTNVHSMTVDLDTSVRLLRITY